MSEFDNWDLSVSSSPDMMVNTMDIRIKVKVPREVIESFGRSETAQRGVVDYIAKRLHQYLDAEFKTKRLSAGARLLGE